MEATDQEMFDSAIEQTENAPTEATEAPTEAKEEPARDEAGKFTSKATEATQEVEQEPTAQPKAETEAEARIPSWRLAEESQRRREAEQQLADMRAEMRQLQLAVANRPNSPGSVPIFCPMKGATDWSLLRKSARRR